MPVLGLGVWQMAAGAETEQAVEWALEEGYRHIDTASMYRNEQSVGAALKHSGLPREQVFVTTKLMPARTSAKAELEKSLRRLGLDYVDLYLIHWPLPMLNARMWRQLEWLQEAGLAKEIGVSNFGRERLARLIRDAHISLLSIKCSSAPSSTAGGCSTTASSRASCSRPTARSPEAKGFSIR
jgi:diketogulonate reductase-like aldo/keto reductase